MIRRICTATTQNTVPYRNIALEEQLLHAVEEDECILYLWQNRRTVVIGRNQNCRAQCRVTELEQDGGYLARRLSGGGAVFHDLGNLNFTFLARSGGYSVERQLEVILQGVRALGVSAEKSGRNDLTAEGRKFSGNAFYTSGDRRYHHGTLLVDADMSALSRYLTVPPDKLAAKGVQSVRSRVVNLAQLSPGMTVDGLKAALIRSFGEVYGLTPEPLEAGRIDPGRLAEGTERFASYDWRVGGEPDYTTRLYRRFGWGGVELRLLAAAGVIAGCTVYTDAMDAELAPLLQSRLTGVRFTPRDVTKALSPEPGQSAEQIAMLYDVAKLMEEWQNE